MKKLNKIYWQISAGDEARDFSDVFLKFGIMLIGPDHGNFFWLFLHYTFYVSVTKSVILVISFVGICVYKN